MTNNQTENFKKALYSLMDDDKKIMKNTITRKANNGYQLRYADDEMFDLIKNNKSFQHLTSKDNIYDQIAQDKNLLKEFKRIYIESQPSHAHTHT